MSDFAFLPFGGGSRKCVGDQFAMMEAVATTVMVLQKFDLSLATPPEVVGMKTGGPFCVLQRTFTVVLI